MNISQQNFYEILEINEDATLQEIERAYMAAKETYSAESAALYSMFTPEEAGALHNLIEQAYNTLSNSDRREQYDQNIISFKSSDDSSAAPLFMDSPLKAEEVSVVRNGVLMKNFDSDASIEESIKSLTDCSGSFLQKVRNYKNISLEEISSFSKISKTNILAVEEQDFSNLPAKVFVRGFVIQICKLLGIDSLAFSKEYLKSLDEFRK